MTQQAQLPKFTIAGINNRPVVPEESERYSQTTPRPVARRDLPRDFNESMQMRWDDNLLHNCMFDYDFANAIRPFSAGMFSNRIEDAEVPGWREVAQKYAKEGLILNSIWGIRHGIEFALGTGEATVPDEVHQFLLDTFGERFLGWENGEQDAEYLGHYVFGTYVDGKTLDPNRSRKEAYEHFMHFHRDMLDNLMHNYMAAIWSHPFFHCSAELGHRIIGLELGTGLPSSIMRAAFLRGASVQYDVLTHGHISLFMASPEKQLMPYSMRGYPSKGRGLQIENQYSHPEGGLPISLAKRLWYGAYMNGVSLLGLEGSVFYDHFAGLPEDWFGAAPKGVKNYGQTREASSVCDVAKYRNRNLEPQLEANLTPLGMSSGNGSGPAANIPSAGSL